MQIHLISILQHATRYQDASGNINRPDSSAGAALTLSISIG